MNLNRSHHLTANSTAAAAAADDDDDSGSPFLRWIESQVTVALVKFKKRNEETTCNMLVATEIYIKLNHTQKYEQKKMKRIERRV